MTLHDMTAMLEKETQTALIKRLLGSLGLNDVWFAQYMRNVNIFQNLVNQLLQDQFR